MQPKGSITRLARKEVAQFFSSPVAFVFLGTFLAVSLFSFFWVDAFFARNIADVRPLFQSMPLLLIFLVAALTMRMWSEERRMGTIEFLMTLPVTPLQLVLGKFLACMILLGVALLLTLPLPVTVSFLGVLDWGPVFGAYVAALFLGASYIAIGLFVSSRNDSQIVSLILTVLVCLGFYLLGSDQLASLFSQRTGEWLQSLSTGVRFDAITRGILDVRDIYYYLSLVGVFLTLNVLGLEKQRWSTGSAPRQHHKLWYAVIGVAIANLVVGNVWLSQVKTLRADLTTGQIYSISGATRQTLARLEEPLLIRGYFSAKTHPLLAPLVPQLRDLLKEYAVVGEGRVRVEFIDPQLDPELEDEANTKYNIKPVPFQVSDKYQASLVNSYFNVLLSYGDQFEVLGFRDLIEVKEQAEMDIEVRLRNPEYDITKGIKKVLGSFQSSGDLFASIRTPVTLSAYISTDTALPQELVGLRQGLDAVLEDLQQRSGGKLSATIEDPQAGDGQLAQTLLDQYGIRPMAVSLLSDAQFYFYLLLGDGRQTVQVALPETLTADALKRNIEAGLKRFAGDFTRTVGLLAPQAEQNPYAPPSNSHVFDLLRDKLSETLSVTDVDLADGKVPEDVQLLILAAPENLSEKQLFAIDQFLMQGGTLVLATSPLATELTRTSLLAKPYSSGLEAWLEHHGLRIDKSLVLDPLNARFPIPVTRNVGGFQFQEVALLDYPYFADIRSGGLNQDSMITAGLPQVTFSWASPLTFDSTRNTALTLTELVKTSPGSWVSESLEITPRMGETQQTTLWKPEGETGAELVGALVEGRFESYFKGRPSPLLSAPQADPASPEKTAENGEEDAQKPSPPTFGGVLERSAESARIFLFTSNEFITDQTVNLSSSMERTLYLNSLQLVQNAVDWSLEDRDLLAIRSRSQFANTLEPMDSGRQMFWEYLNYGLMLVGLALIYAVYRGRVASQHKRHARLLEAEGTA